MMACNAGLDEMNTGGRRTETQKPRATLRLPPSRDKNGNEDSSAKSLESKKPQPSLLACMMVSNGNPGGIYQLATRFRVHRIERSRTHKDQYD